MSYSSQAEPRPIEETSQDENRPGLWRRIAGFRPQRNKRATKYASGGEHGSNNADGPTAVRDSFATLAQQQHSTSSITRNASSTTPTTLPYGTEDNEPSRPPNLAAKALAALIKFSNFIGPGAMVSVAYIDPGNYATSIAAGATYRFRLLFVVLLSNVFAIFLQSLCIKLGSVTGLNLAQMIKLHCPPWLNYVLYIFAEAAIIATDIAEVIGTAIALNLLVKLPLVAGCIISILDVLIILFFYRPGKSMRGVRAFEMFVLALVLGVVVCFCYQLSLIQNTSVADVFAGYLPSSALVESQGLYQACGILGATVMPHSLYLGSGTCQPRLLHFDKTHGRVSKSVELDGLTHRNNSEDGASDYSVSSDNPTDTDQTPSPSSSDTQTNYLPSLAAISHCLRMSTIELTFCLLTFALFVNSAILIVAGASLYSPDDDSASDASLFQIHTLLSTHISPSAGTLFALALLLSGTSAGIVCTIAGQMVSEAQLAWRVKPWVRRLLTRSLSIMPSVIIAGAVGGQGLTRALEASQVVLCFCLPAVVGPLVWFTARAQYLSVCVGPDGQRVPAQRGARASASEAWKGSFGGLRKRFTRGQRDGVAEEKRDAPASAVNESNVQPVFACGQSPTRNLRTRASRNSEDLTISSCAHGSLTTTMTIRKRDTTLGQPELQPQLRSQEREQEDEPHQHQALTISHQAQNASVSESETTNAPQTVHFRNHWLTTVIAVMVWLLIVVMNTATIVLLGIAGGLE